MNKYLTAGTIAFVVSVTLLYVFPETYKLLPRGWQILVACMFLSTPIYILLAAVEGGREKR